MPRDDEFSHPDWSKAGSVTVGSLRRIPEAGPNLGRPAPKKAVK